ncbi:DUF1481 domain-containing protein [Escherichia coli]|uniref:DUF1481 domain-containing protein n=1 Tax=Escherichia coli TaxID=562 RepID=UPI00388E63B4
MWRKDSGDNVHLLAVFSPWRSGDTTTREYRWQGDNLTLININNLQQTAGEYSRVWRSR